MSPDMLAVVDDAIENKETRIWLFPKGHPYLIGECGRPTVGSNVIVVKLLVHHKITKSVGIDWVRC